jgi:membrane-associated protein
MHEIIDFFLHIDRHLAPLLAEYGWWVHAILFLVVFFETGLVVTPFLPGDSLLFAAGALAATGGLSLPVLLLGLSIAAILGDSVNYRIGAMVGTGVFKRDSKILKREYLTRTEAFYARYGGKTIVLARFVPIVRTVAPFLAGAGQMNYGRFLLFNVTGGLFWVFVMTLAGYFIGNVPLVRDNFGLVTIGIILLSILPLVIEIWRARRARPVTDGIPPAPRPGS